MTTKKLHFSKAEKTGDRLVLSQKEGLWKGPFSEQDIQEIKTLRDNQAHAIIKGDAEAYANLCADDVQLMIPGHDIVSGRAQFLAAENALFENATFSKFTKYPEKIERSGDMVVEIGRQEVSMKKSTDKDGVFSARQKYIHIFRLSAVGWRYAVLMSNHCE
ncbi:nuclear transport factor 2 family protein [Nitrospira defluvii]|nr:nuclear transport factor 2 family protein [Nitrospira defluvii]